MFTILKSIGAYALGVIVCFLFCHWFFDRPSDHGILIPFITGCGASALACNVIEEEHIRDKDIEFAHYVIVGIVTSFFWVYQFIDTYNDYQGFRDSNPIVSGIATVITSWSDLLMAAITFFGIVVSNAPQNFSFDKLKSNMSDILDSPQPNSEEPQPDILETLRNENKNAIKEADKAIELNPNDANAYHKRGCAYHSLKQYERAIEDLDKAVDLNPNFPDTYVFRGLSYSGLKQYERAIQDFDKAVELNSNDETAYSSRGDAYFELKQYERAIRDYDKAIELSDPDDDLLNTSVYYNRGKAYHQLKQYKRAIQDFSQVIKVDSNDMFDYHMFAYHDRGLCYRAINDELNAQADLDKAKALGYSD